MHRKEQRPNGEMEEGKDVIVVWWCDDDNVSRAQGEHPRRHYGSKRLLMNS